MSSKISRDPALLAVLATVTASELARRIGVKRQAVSGWRRIPVGRVRAVAEITGIPARVLRPDVFE